MSKNLIGKNKTRVNATRGVHPPKAMKFYRVMPDSFTTVEYQEAGQLGDSEVDRYLKWLIKFRKIECTKSGNYRKL